MTLHPIDHLAFLLIVAAWPAVAFVSLRRRAALIREGRVEMRLKTYRATAVEEWVVAGALVALWFALGRSAAELGITLRGGALAWTGYGLTALIAVGLLLQARYVVRHPESHEAVRRKIGELDFLTPHTLPERKMFDALSLTAGVCEEIVFRGYLFAYLGALLAAPPWLCVALTSVLFGLAHAYQGPLGIVRTATAGLVFGSLYALTGSLWAPILAHAMLDVTSGRIAYAAACSDGPRDATPELAA